MAITGVSNYRRAVWSVESLPEGRKGVYQLAFPFQLSATEIGVKINIRQTGVQTIDLEIGSDLLIVDHIGAIDPRRIQVLNRCEVQPHPVSGKPTLFAPYPALGGFVPLGARRADGTPHPHAGTGFSISELEGFPADRFVPNVMQYEGAENYHFHGLQVQQYIYDGSDFKILRTENVGCRDLLPGYFVHHGGLASALPDGDDLIQPVCAGRNLNEMGCGVLRWRRLDGEWRAVEYTAVTITESTDLLLGEEPAFVVNEMLGDYTEPSMVREADGSLLYSARAHGPTPYAPGPMEAEHVAVWQSLDNGCNWTQILYAPDVRALTPTTINSTVDGTVYIAANPARIHNSLGEHANSIVMRESIQMWPLSADRKSLLEPVTLRDTTKEFGKAPNGSYWRVDHPVGVTARLSDGRWHHLIGFRGLEHDENDFNAPVTAFTGSYLEEVFSDGEPLPTWNFDESNS